MYEKGMMVIEHPDWPREVHPLCNGVSFCFYEQKGDHKLSLNCWVDFVDLEDSELVGGSEVYALIWGLRVDENEFYQKGVIRESSDVSAERDEDADVSALFFSGEFSPISKLRCESMGKGRFRLHLVVQDITGLSDDDNTNVWIDGTLDDAPCEMSYPE